MTDRWDQRWDKKLGPAKIFVSIVPMWIRIGVILATLGCALYWAFWERGPFPSIHRALGSVNLSFLLGWLMLLAPALVLIYSTAALLHRRKRKQREADFPSARIHQ